MQFQTCFCSKNGILGTKRGGCSVISAISTFTLLQVGGLPLLRKRQIVPSISLTFLKYIYQYNELRTIIISLGILNIALAVIFYNNVLMVINYAKLIVVQRTYAIEKLLQMTTTKCLKFNCCKGKNNYFKSQNYLLEMKNLVPK